MKNLLAIDKKTFLRENLLAVNENVADLLLEKKQRLPAEQHAAPTPKRNIRLIEKAARKAEAKAAAFFKAKKFEEALKAYAQARRFYNIAIETEPSRERYFLQLMERTSIAIRKIQNIKKQTGTLGTGAGEVLTKAGERSGVGVDWVGVGGEGPSAMDQAKQEPHHTEKLKTVMSDKQRGDVYLRNALKLLDDGEELFAKRYLLQVLEIDPENKLAQEKLRLILQGTPAMQNYPGPPRKVPVDADDADEPGEPDPEEDSDVRVESDLTPNLYALCDKGREGVYKAGIICDKLGELTQHWGSATIKQNKLHNDVMKHFDKVLGEEGAVASAKYLAGEFGKIGDEKNQKLALEFAKVLSDPNTLVKPKEEKPKGVLRNIPELTYTFEDGPWKGNPLEIWGSKKLFKYGGTSWKLDEFLSDAFNYEDWAAFKENNMPDLKAGNVKPFHLVFFVKEFVDNREKEESKFKNFREGDLEDNENDLKIAQHIRSVRAKFIEAVNKEIFDGIKNKDTVKRAISYGGEFFEKLQFRNGGGTSYDIPEKTMTVAAGEKKTGQYFTPAEERLGRRIGIIPIPAGAKGTIRSEEPADTTPRPEVPVTPAPGGSPGTDVTPGPDVLPEPTPDVTPEPTPDVTPEPTPDVTPEPEPEPEEEEPSGKMKAGGDITPYEQALEINKSNVGNTVKTRRLQKIINSLAPRFIGQSPRGKRIKGGAKGWFTEKGWRQARRALSAGDLAKATKLIKQAQTYDTGPPGMEGLVDQAKKEAKRFHSESPLQAGQFFSENELPKTWLPGGNSKAKIGVAPDPQMEGRMFIAANWGDGEVKVRKVPEPGWVWVNPKERDKVKKRDDK